MTSTRRTKSLAGRRRKIDGDEDDNASVMSGDSDVSALSDHSTSDDQELADNSDVSDPSSTGIHESCTDKVLDANSVARQAQAPVSKADIKHMSTDSAVVMPMETDRVGPVASNGVEDAAATAQPIEPSRTRETLAERRRREHDEYRQKRDSDPSFVPNRGNFFMHDARSVRPRTTETRTRPGGPSKASLRRDPIVDSKWTHDLHELVNEVEYPKPVARPNANGSRSQGAKFASAKRTKMSFSRHIGNVQVRICLPHMSEPKRASAKLHSHTLLPDYYPKLRRDKAIRIAVPDMSMLTAYAMPSTDRSYVYGGPRPKQQGARSSVALEPFSRRNSFYGDSRRATTRSGSESSSVGCPPTHAATTGFSKAGRQAHDVVGEAPSKKNTQNEKARPDPPQAPHVQHHCDTSIMHQPSPQKGFAVDEIDAQAALSLQIPAGNHAQEPFENQLPREYQLDCHSASSSSLSGMPSAVDPYYIGRPQDAVHGPFLLPDNMAEPNYYGMPYLPAQFPQLPIPVYDQSMPCVPGMDYSTTMPDGANMMAQESNGMMYYLHDQSQMFMPQTFAGGYMMPGLAGGPEVDGSIAASMYYPSMGKNMEWA